MSKFWACSASMVLAIGSGLPAFAQSSATSGLQLEEIVVTAEKRAESLQKTSISIQVKEGEDLAKTGKKRIDEIMQGTVGIQAQDSQVGVTFFVRGVDSGGGMGGVVSVPVLVDGVAQSRSESVRGGTLDLAQAEIMRGPQSTTVGANALAGAVSLVSNKPVFEYQANGSLEVGNFNKLATEGVLNVPLADNQALRIAYNSDKRDGYISAGAGDSDLKHARVKYRIQPTSDVDVVATIDHQNIGGNGVQQGVLLATGHWEAYTAAAFPTLYTTTGSCAPNPVTGVLATMGCPGMFVAVTDGINYKQRSNPWSDGYPADLWPNNPYRDTKITQGSVELNWTTGLGTVTFLPSYQTAHFRSQEPPRGTSWMNEDQKQDTTTLDLRMTSSSTGPLSWQTGLYYSKDRVHDGSFLSVDFPGGGMGGSCAAGGPYCYTYSLTNYQAREGASGYFNTEYSLTDALRLVAAARYNKDRSALSVLSADVTGTYLGPDAAAVASTSSTHYTGNWHATTYRAGVEWDVLPDMMLYGSYSTGYNPGSVDSMSGTVSVKTELEQITAGWKSQWLDNRLQFNGELFYSTFHNRTVEGTVSTYFNTNSTTCTTTGMAATVAVVTVNASLDQYCVIIAQNAAVVPEFVSKGLDADLTWLISANDRLTLTGEYLRAAFDAAPQVYDMGAAVNVAAAISSQVADTNVAAALTDGVLSGLAAYQGQSLQNSPKFSATLDYQHAFQFAGGSKLTPRLAGTYKSRYWSFGGAPGANVSEILRDTSDSNLAWQQGYSKWDFYTTWDNADGKLSVTGYVKNLENEAVLANYTDPYVSLEAPRTYGVTFNANF